MECNYTLRRMAATMTAVEMTRGFYDLMHKTKTNAEFVERLPVWEKQLAEGMLKKTAKNGGIFRKSCCNPGKTML